MKTAIDGAASAGGGNVKQRGTIYIASMNLRGQWAERINPLSSPLNVTSAQSTKSLNRLDFSPMTAAPGGYKGYLCFENYWQAGKVYEHVSHAVSKGWWLKQLKPHRRYPGSKGKKVLHSVFVVDNVVAKLNYIESRKLVYVKEYSDYIRNSKMLQYWKKHLDGGHDITIYDFDGPRMHDGGVQCLKLTNELLVDKINDPIHPFGHGFVVGALLASIPIEAFCD